MSLVVVGPDPLMIFWYPGTFSAAESLAGSELACGAIVRGLLGGWLGGGGAFLVGRGTCFLPGLAPELLRVTFVG